MPSGVIKGQFTSVQKCLQVRLNDRPISQRADMSTYATQPVLAQIQAPVIVQLAPELQVQTARSIGQHEPVRVVSHGDFPPESGDVHGLALRCFFHGSNHLPDDVSNLWDDRVTKRLDSCSAVARAFGNPWRFPCFLLLAWSAWPTSVQPSGKPINCSTQIGFNDRLVLIDSALGRFT
jgi:hypothetical protein